MYNLYRNTSYSLCPSCEGESNTHWRLQTPSILAAYACMDDIIRTCTYMHDIMLCHIIILQAPQLLLDLICPVSVAQLRQAAECPTSS